MARLAELSGRQANNLRYSWASIGLSLALALTFCHLPASAKSTAKEVLKYFNPVPEKHYLNESQDRLIKKNKFKAHELPASQSAPNKEIGIFALVRPAELEQTEKLDVLLSHGEINGLSVLTSWKLIEREEGEYNWQPIDQLVELVRKHNKTLILRIATAGIDLPSAQSPNSSGTANTQMPESDTPQWVFASGVKSVSYTGLDGKLHALPLFWDSNYLASWSNFIKELGRRYDKNPGIHSIGITGGGAGGGTAILPSVSSPDAKVKDAQKQLLQTLKKEHGMSQHQLVEHWKYVADLFPKAFPTARLNFNIDPPMPNRAGQDILDEISDYLVYRYGQRVYLTRQNVADDKHGFDEYRVLLKFRPDTLTGIQLSESFDLKCLEKLSQFSLDDGISFAEIPVKFLENMDENAQKLIGHLAKHIGYQIVSQKATIPQEIHSGEPMQASFTFTNFGAATPSRPVRTFDKDVAGSYKVEIELRDQSGKPVLLSYHTPPVPTNQWTAGKAVTWSEELRMPALPPGDYLVFMSLVEPESARKIKMLDHISQTAPAPEDVIPLGKIHIAPGGSTIGSSSPPPQ